jgi:hypothetical protein
LFSKGMVHILGKSVSCTFCWCAIH